VGRKRDGYYKRQAQAIYALQMREAATRLKLEGRTDPEIAQDLGQTVSTVRRYRTQAVKRSAARERIRREYGELEPPAETAAEEDARLRREHAARKAAGWKPPVSAVHRAARWPEGDGAGASRALSLPAPADSGSAGPPPGGSGGRPPDEVLDPPDADEYTEQMRRECLWLRKAAIPFDQMALKLGISERDARRYTFEALRHLQESEMNNADLERRLLIEQLDDMIRAVRPLAVGGDGGRPPILEAVDRMLKLFKQKSDLMGLSQAPAVDIMIRLQGLAEEGGYDIIELEDIARDVLSAHKIRLPEFR
jgi:DNA-binding CsgD family transcriptional regulator